MRTTSLTILAALTLTLSAPAFAAEQPRIIPRVQAVARPVSEVYATLKKYFTDSSLSNFQLVSDDPEKHTLIARQSGIPTNTWSDWAFCKTGPMQMIFAYQDGTVTVTVNLEKRSKNSTFAHVTADFQGSYGLGANQKTVACVSKGAVEDSILTAAGPVAPK
jgi:hypothetical protein